MAFVNLEDILVASSSLEQQHWDAEEIFATSPQLGQSSTGRSVSYPPMVHFLGYHITAKGIMPLQHKVSATQTTRSQRQ
jgi:hypothetical protein